MSERMLHILAPARYDSVAAIVGDLAALHQLRTAITDAIDSGTGGAHLRQSDGEGYSLCIVCAADMDHVCTTYAGEVAPARSRRETVTIRGIPRFADALRKASPQTKAVLLSRPPGAGNPAFMAMAPRAHDT